MKMRKLYPLPHVRFYPTKNLAVNQYLAVCKTGRVISNKLAYADITIMRTGVSHSIQHLNGVVLREALLNSKEFMAEYLGIGITDLTIDTKAEEVPEEEPVPEETPEEVVFVKVVDEPIDIPESPVAPENLTGELGLTTEESVIEEEPVVENTPLGDVETVKKNDEYQEKLDKLNEMTNAQLRERLKGFGIAGVAKMNKKQLVGEFINNHLV